MNSLNIDHVIVPGLLRLLGTGSLGHQVTKCTKKGLAACLSRKGLEFQSQTLTAMFQEADFRQKGFLDASDLSAAISGAFCSM